MPRKPKITSGKLSCKVLEKISKRNKRLFFFRERQLARRNVYYVVYVLTVASTLVFVTACAKSKTKHSEDASILEDARFALIDAEVKERRDAHATHATNINCNSEASLIVDYYSDVPEDGQSAYVSNIAASANDLYYIVTWDPNTGSFTEGYLMRVPIHGGESVRMAVVSGGGRDRQGMALTSTSVVFIERRDDIEGAITRVSIDGGEPTAIARTSGVARALFVDNEKAFFVDSEAIKSVSLEGGEVRTLVEYTPQSIDIVGQTLYLAVSGSILSMPIDGGQTTVLASAQGNALYLTGCGSNTYWLNADPQNGSLMQLGSGEQPVMVAERFHTIYDLVCDGENLFVAAGRFSGVLVRITVEGGAYFGVSTDSDARRLAFDEHCLYWAGYDGIYSRAINAIVEDN